MISNCGDKACSIYFSESVITVLFSIGLWVVLCIGVLLGIYGDTAICEPLHGEMRGFSDLNEIMKVTSGGDIFSQIFGLPPNELNIGKILR